MDERITFEDNAWTDGHEIYRRKVEDNFGGPEDKSSVTGTSGCRHVSCERTSQRPNDSSRPQA
jgi:hypothetical protein